MHTDVLVVNPDPAALQRVGTALTLAGFVPTLAATFAEAKALLSTWCFDSVIAAHRLNAYNGLQLVLRARAGGTRRAVVTTTAPDPVLEREAEHLGAVTVVAPWEDATALLAVLGPADHLEPVADAIIGA